MGLPVGTVLAGRYRVLARLGEGGMGNVYQVSDLKRPGAIWALKELLDDQTASPDEVTAATLRFDAEIRLLGAVRHPRVPALVDTFDEGGRRYFVMEYVPGATLDECLDHAGGPLPERDVLTWMIAVCDVLAYLHTRQPPIIVRDLKPANVMVTPEGDARLIDLGIARTYKPGKLGNTENLGTEVYASPEHHGRGQTDARSDIYSLGATLYHLLTGREPAPLQPPAPGELARQHPAISPATAAIIARATRLDPGWRYQTAEELRAALRAALAALPASASPATGFTPSGRAAPVAAGMAWSRGQPAASAPPAGVAASAPAPGTVICPRCGHRNRPGARYCARDGAPLGDARTATRAAPPTPAVAIGDGIAASALPAPAGSTAQLHAQRATVALSSGRITQAISQAQTAIAQGHTTYETYLLLGRALREGARPAEAVEAFAQAAKVRPTAEALLAEGEAACAARNWSAAQIALTRALQLDPQNTASAVALARACREQGQFAQAEGEIRGALELHPDAPALLVALGELYLARREWPEAISTLRRALTLDPTCAAGHLALGRALLATHRHAEAARALEAGRRAAPESAELLTALGMAYHALGRRAQARELLRRAAGLAPRDAEVQRLLKSI